MRFESSPSPNDARTVPFAHLIVTSTRPPAGGRRNLLAATVLLSVVLSSTILFNEWGDWRAYAGAGTLFVSNLLLLVGVYVAVLPRLRALGRPAGG